MSHAWTSRPLGELCRTSSGGTPDRSRLDFFGGDIPWVKSGDLNDGTVTSCSEKLTAAGLDNSNAKLLAPGTILVAMYGATVGKLGVLGMEAATNQAVCGLTPPDGLLNREFLFYFLLSRRRQLIARSIGGAQPNISQKIIRQLLVPLPSMEEQVRIVDLLTRAEGIVRLRREAAAKAAELIPAMFIEMFGDPETNPRQWAEMPLGDVVEEFRYGTSQKSGATGLPVLRIPNVIGGDINPHEVKLVELNTAEATRLTLRDGDLLFVRTNGNQDYVGRSAVYRSATLTRAGFEGSQCVYASYLIRARLGSGRLTPTFLQDFLATQYGRRLMRERAKTSAGQFNINT